MNTNTLFNLADYTSTAGKPRTIDPYWDEIVLDCSGKVELNGQLTLFYDETEEPPEPDDYPTLADYYRAWIEWENRFPEQVQQSVPKSWKRIYKGYESEFHCAGKHNGYYIISFSATDTRDGLMVGTWFDHPYPSTTHAELVFVEYIDKWHSENEDVVLEDEESILSELPEQTLEPLPEQRKAQWVEQYYVTRGTNKHWYYRYCYYQNSKITHIHIPGGNIKSNRAQERKRGVEEAIASGKSPSEIEKLIKSF